MSFLNPFSLMPIPQVVNPFAGIQKTIHNVMVISGIAVILIVILVAYITWHSRAKIKHTVETGVREAIKLAPLALL